MSINLCLIIRALQCYNLTISMRTPNIPPIFTLRGIRTLMRSTATFLAQPALAMRTTSRIIPILTNIYRLQSHTAHRLGITPKRRLRLPLIRTVSTLDTTPQLVPKPFNIPPTSRSILTRRTNSQSKFPTLSTRTITIPGMLIPTRLDLRPTIHINPTARVPTTGAPRCMLLLRQIYRRRSAWAILPTPKSQTRLLARNNKVMASLHSFRTCFILRRLRRTIRRRTRACRRMDMQ
jgi:hypothetical protein